MSPYLFQDKQGDTARERNTAWDGRQLKRSGFIRRYFQRADIGDLFSGRVGDPLISKSHDPMAISMMARIKVGRYCKPRQAAWRIRLKKSLSEPAL